jgi:hypothetical protein
MSSPWRALGIGVSAVAFMSLGDGAARRGNATVTVTMTQTAHRSHAPAPSARLLEDAAPCPPHTLPDDSVCVDWPESDRMSPGKNGVEGPLSERERWGADDEIPRRPDRPLDYQAYRYPMLCSDCVVGDDRIERSSFDQPRDRLPRAGHGGIDLTVPSGTSVTAISLANQDGPTELVYVGDLLGATVVTLHSVKEAGGKHAYIVVLGHLDSVAPELPRPAASKRTPPIALQDGQPLGWVGARLSPRLAHLRLEVRRVRKGVDVRALQPSALIDPASTIACDPRNVLPLK